MSDGISDSHDYYEGRPLMAGRNEGYRVTHDAATICKGMEAQLAEAQRELLALRSEKLECLCGQSFYGHNRWNPDCPIHGEHRQANAPAPRTAESGQP